MKAKLLTILSLVLMSSMLFAQAPNLSNGTKPVADDKPVDGYYKKSNILSAKVSPYANLREADVMYAKRVWREIDLREKANKAFASPKARLIDHIVDAVKAGELTAYDAAATKENPDGDDVSHAAILTPEQAFSKFADSVLVPTKTDPNTGDILESEMRPGEFNPDSIIKFRIKEDWIFDKQRGVFEPRIVAIAPMINIKAAGVSLGDQPAFWLYFPELRNILVTKEVVNSDNDATGLSYDDVFVKRLFSSYIVKESNSENLRIKDYANGVDKLYESERIKKEIMDKEHDLWSY